MVDNQTLEEKQQSIKKIPFLDDLLSGAIITAMSLLTIILGMTVFISIIGTAVILRGSTYNSHRFNIHLTL